MGIKRIIETAKKMGIDSPLDDTPSLALGSSDVNLLEMACAYSTISNNGKHHDPVLVTKIVDHDGKVVYEGPSTEEQVIPYKSAFLMQQLLQGGMREPGGTSQSLWGYVGNYRDTEFGGKTGTTDEAGCCVILYSEDLEKNPYISIIMGAEDKSFLYQEMNRLLEAGETTKTE